MRNIKALVYLPSPLITADEGLVASVWLLLESRLPLPPPLSFVWEGSKVDLFIYLFIL